MNGLLLASSPESKDIKFNPKKIADTQDELLVVESNFFQNLMQDLLHEMPDSQNKDFLIAKILDLPKDFAKKEEIRSSFSDEKLFTDHQINKVSIESLIEIASFLKTHPQEQTRINFPTDSKALQTSLLDLNVQEKFKNAKTISDLLKIAEKNDIEVKNFTFFKEEAALDTHAKEMVKKINSEEIFKLIENHSTKKQHKTVPENNPLQHETIHKQKEHNLLKNMLSDLQTDQKPKASAFTPTTIQKTFATQTSTLVTSSFEQPHLNLVQKSISPKTPLPQEQQNVKHADTIVLKNPVSLQTLTSKHAETKDLAVQEEQIKATKPLQQETNIHDKAKISQTKTIAKETSFKEQIKTPDMQTRVYKNNIAHVDKTTIQQIAANTPVKNENPLKENEVKTKKEADTKTINIFPPKTSKNVIHVSQKYAVEDKNFSHILKAESEKNISETEQNETHHVEQTTVSHETKTQPLQHHKIQNHHQTDFKKTLNTFAQEFKEQVENYKAPLMKIKMQLNPGNLGDVDVTLISRGNNLQVNINSNPSTIAIFTQNQTEFKNALVNMGFSGLQMNFGENKDSGRGQQHRENNKQTHYSDEESQEKDGFEMIVPRYV